MEAEKKKEVFLWQFTIPQLSVRVWNEGSLN